MRRLTEQELSEKTEREKESVQTLTKNWDEIPEERRGRLYGGLGQRTRAVGIYSLLRGETSEGGKWLEEASDWYLKAWEFRRGGENEVQNLLWALETSVLAKNTDLMQTAADKADLMEYEDPAYFYHFNSCLAGLIRGETDRVRTASTELDELEEGGAPSRLEYYDGLGRACQGIVSDDLTLVDEGLTDILDRHEVLVLKLGDTMDDALVCYPATTLLILAAERGLPVQNLDCIGNEYVLWDLVEDD